MVAGSGWDASVAVGVDMGKRSFVGSGAGRAGSSRCSRSYLADERAVFSILTSEKGFGQGGAAGQLSATDRRGLTVTRKRLPRFGHAVRERIARTGMVFAQSNFGL